MTLLNFSDSSEKPAGRRKPLRAILGIGALVGAVALGSTLAASINLNDSGPVEFGQGVVQTTACDDEITITPYSTFVNEDGGGSFMGTSIVISGVDSSTEGCSGKNLTITGFTSSEPIAQIMVEVASASPWFTIDDVYGATLDDVSSSSFTIVIDPNILSIEASEVTRFTIESSGTTQEVDLTGWSDITWTEANSSGPTVYANSLTTGRPLWINALNAESSPLSFDFTPNGMHITGDADDEFTDGVEYPYVTDFGIPDTQKVTVQFTFFHNEECADHGVILFNQITIPRWSWENNATGLVGQWDCGAPQIGGYANSVGGLVSDDSTGILNIGQAYIAIFTYDPTLPANNLTLVTKELGGDVIDTISLTTLLSPGPYLIGFSADQDDGEPNSYFKNLIITLG
jgi:hypothetical protein